MSFSPIPIAVLLGGIWLIIASQEAPSDSLTLIFGIAIAVLAVIAWVPFQRSS